MWSNPFILYTYRQNEGPRPIQTLSLKSAFKQFLYVRNLLQHFLKITIIATLLCIFKKHSVSQ